MPLLMRPGWGSCVLLFFAISLLWGYDRWGSVPLFEVQPSTLYLLRDVAVACSLQSLRGEQEGFRALSLELYTTRNLLSLGALTGEDVAHIEQYQQAAVEHKGVVAPYGLIVEHITREDALRGAPSCLIYGTRLHRTHGLLVPARRCRLSAILTLSISPAK